MLNARFAALDIFTFEFRIMRNKLPSFIKLPRNKTFDFQPRYYDAEKEELEERKARILRQLEAEKKGELNSELLRERLRADWQRGDRQIAISKSNIRIAMIAGFLFIVVYLYLTT